MYSLIENMNIATVYTKKYEHFIVSEVSIFVACEGVRDCKMPPIFLAEAFLTSSVYKIIGHQGLAKNS